MVLEFIKKQFTNFSENRKINQEGFRLFEKEIRDKIKDKGQVSFSPQQTPDIFVWNVSIKNDKPSYSSPTGKLRGKRLFKNLTVYYLRHTGILVALIKNKTGQFYDKEEITEVWGYRMMLIDNSVIVEP